MSGGGLRVENEGMGGQGGHSLNSKNRGENRGLRKRKIFGGGREKTKKGGE